jgi:Zn-dependent protease with chaperone function
MARSLQAVRKELLRVSLCAVLALFTLPLLTLAFSQHVLAERDKSFLANTEQQLITHGESPEKQQALFTLFRAHPPSTVCSSTAPELSTYREIFCEPFSEHWQFYWAAQASKYTLVASALILFTVALLGLLAFRNRASQYLSLIIGWRVLALSGAVQVTVQSAMLVWLSFWVSAFFLHKYSIKLVTLFAIVAAVAAGLAWIRIFKRISASMTVEGEVLPEHEAAPLWERIRRLAAQLGTAPPDHIIAGIDANFFVTEAEMMVNGQTLRGRSLFVSLPLLNVLDQAEADAVLAHELAHLRGGDTSNSAALGPKLMQFDAYRGEMYDKSLTIVAYYLLTLYRIILELALKQDSREREFMADSAAAERVGGGALIRALIKITAYDAYRNRIERELFEKRQRHDETLGIPAFVAQGLQPFAHSDEFLTEMEMTKVPHPFDSHPAISERMENVGCVIPEREYGAVVGAAVTHPWTSEISTAASIESRLWGVYESEFAGAHEQDLAFRYRPDGDAERAIVLKHFPPQVFELKRGKRFQVAYDGLTLPGEEEFIAWQDIKDLKYTEGFGGDLLTILRTERGLFGQKTAKVKLPGIKAKRDELGAALGAYWHRHKVSHGAS